MTIEILIVVDSTSSQEVTEFTNQLLGILPIQITKVGAICQTADEEVVLVIRDSETEPHELDLTANTITISDDHNEVQIVAGDTKHVVTEFDPVIISNGIAIDHIASGSTNVVIVLFADKVEYGEEGITPDLYRDLQSEMRQVGRPEEDISPGEEFYQIRLRGFKQLGIEK